MSDQPRPSVPDLLRDPCVHDQPPCGSCGDDHIRPDARDCDDCVRLALAAAREEREAKLRRENEWLRAAHLLIAGGEAWAHSPETGPFFIDATASANGEVGLSLNMSDTFYYACADAEPFSYEDAPELLRIARVEGWPGLVRWVSQKRGGQKPIEPVAKRMNLQDKLRADLAAARERNEALETVCSAAATLLARLDVVLPKVPWTYLYAHGFRWTTEQISAEDELKALRDALAALPAAPPTDGGAQEAKEVTDAD